jgi:arginyl-tRNA synthetase
VRQLSSSHKVAEQVGLGAIKYSFLKNNPLQDITFDVEESISTEGNSGPYLQYTYARCQSVLRKAKYRGMARSLSLGEVNSEELSLLRKFIHFPEIVEEAAEKYSPNLICNYLFDLAQKFNSFYNAREFRLVLTQATSQILKNGLSLLGIQTPEKM